MDTPKRIKTISSQYINSPPALNQTALGTIMTTPGDHRHSYQWHSGAGGWPSETTLVSPASECSSPEAIPSKISTPTTTNNNNWKHQPGSNSADKMENKRGRPRSEALNTLMVEGSISPSAIKCRYCHRVFPREKSLQAHLRTHTGERPYHCDYPGCARAFTQSGQLKTHQRLHTGERPFICSATNCQMRFTHANRHCPDHPYETLKRCDDFVFQAIPEQNGDVLKWLEKYRMEREDRTPTRKTPKRTNQNAQNENKHHRSQSIGNNENHTINGQMLLSPLTPRSPFKSRKGLMCELDMNAGMGLAVSPLTAKTKPNVPKLLQWQEPTSQEEDDSGDESVVRCPAARSTFNPKKKWLRDAWQDDLAKPLEPNIISPQALSSTTSTAALKQQLNQESSNLRQQHSNGTAMDPNQMRPTVLMVASKDCARPLSEQTLTTIQPNRPEENNRKFEGALALMQLATEDSGAFTGQYPADPLASAPIGGNECSGNLEQVSTFSTLYPSSCLDQQLLRIPMIARLPGEIDHSIPFTLAAEAYVNYQ
ncbi:zinc finger protein 1-like [Toxorhynchites rutilus septentrionalis]|uniref:zinc finger protein 1-like n=1 Tax=Toxorhynchites rutilus septentrionalis TaxID=329112 RepID=UPI002479D605|nr:zinc finger protein 1-like [Toxorhynchites rutilus septentrionalis]